MRCARPMWHRLPPNSRSSACRRPVTASRAVIGQGQCVRIFTGAPLPDGRRYRGHPGECRGGDRPDHACMQAATRRRRTCATRGLDFRARRGAASRRRPPQRARHRPCRGGAMPLPSRVRRKPRVALIATGDELVLPGAAARGRTRSSPPTAMRSPPWRSASAAEVDESRHRRRQSEGHRARHRARPRRPTSWSPPAAPRWATMTMCRRR